MKPQLIYYEILNKETGQLRYFICYSDFPKDKIELADNEVIECWDYLHTKFDYNPVSMRK
jgi:hypothetical protein